MTMLTSVVLNLRPVAETWLPISHGTYAYAAVLDMLLRLDPPLSRTLHEPARSKPFTCSPLGGTDRREGFDFLLSPDRLYPWRLTGLTPEISQHLLQLSPRLGGIRIGEAVFSITDVATTPDQHASAGQVTYETLLARWQTQPPPATVTLHFLTPTTFRVGRFEQPFPLPHQVFNSLLSTWNAFAPCPLPDFQATLDESVILSNWKGETRRLELGSYRTVGFEGKFTYRVVQRRPEVGPLLGLLAEFAFYAGVGWQTTHGLGQVRFDFPKPGEKA